MDQKGLLIALEPIADAITDLERKVDGELHSRSATIDTALKAAEEIAERVAIAEIERGVGALAQGASEAAGIVNQIRADQTLAAKSVFAAAAAQLRGHSGETR